MPRQMAAPAFLKPAFIGHPARPPVGPPPAPLAPEAMAGAPPADDVGYTPEQEQALLKNYVRVPEEAWTTIKKGDAVRYYVKKDGVVRLMKGGVVVIPRILASKELPKGKIKLQAEHAPSMTWPVSWEEIQELYVRLPLALYLMKNNLEQALSSLDNNNKKIVMAVKALRARVARLEEREGL